MGALRPQVTNTPLDQICAEIASGLDGGFYYLSLCVSLSLPDVCISLMCAPDKIHVLSGEYIAWAEANLKSRMEIEPAAIYGLRCGVLHNARFEHHKLAASYERISFTLPNRHNIYVDNIQAGTGSARKVSFHLVTFCEQMMAAACAWIAANKDHPNVQANSQPHADGAGGTTRSCT